MAQRKLKNILTDPGLGGDMLYSAPGSEYDASAEAPVEEDDQEDSYPSLPAGVSPEATEMPKPDKLTSYSAPPMPRAPKVAQSIHAPMKLKDYLLAGLSGFAAGGAQPNVAHGGGADLMRGAMAGVQTGLGLVGSKHERENEDAKLAADLEYKKAQAQWENTRPDMAYYQLKLKQELAGDKNDVTKRGQDLRFQGQSDATNQRRETGNRRIDTSIDQNAWKRAVDTGNLNLRLGSGGFQTGVTQDQIANGTAQVAPETDPTKLTVTQQDKHNAALKQVDYMDARTGEIRQRVSMAPQLMKIRERMLGVSLMNAATAQQRVQIARDEYNFNYKGLDENGAPVLVDPDSGERLSPKLIAAQGKPTDSKMAAQADAIIDSGKELSQMVQQLADEGKIGPAMGRWQQVKGKVGLLDPEVKAVVADLSYLASLQPKLHGARGYAYMEDFKNTIGQIEQKPETILEGITRLMSMAEKIKATNLKVYHPSNRRTAGQDKKDAGTVTVYWNSGGKKIPRTIPASGLEAALKTGYTKD